MYKYLYIYQPQINNNMYKGILDDLGLFRHNNIENNLAKEDLIQVINHAINQSSSLYNVSYSDILSKCRKHKMVMARQMVYFILRYKYRCGPKVLSRIFIRYFKFNIDHASIWYGADNYFDVIETNLETYEIYKKLHFLSAIFYSNLYNKKQVKLLPQKGCITTIDLVWIGRKKLQLTDQINDLHQRKRLFEKHINSIEIDIYNAEYDLRMLSDFPYTVLALNRVLKQERSTYNGA